jgi:hypothetical protein
MFISLADKLNRSPPVCECSLITTPFSSVDTKTLHMVQILLWAGIYRWLCFPSWEASFYFSATSYSTVGYGDVVLPPMGRNLGPMESITGVVMCGLSVSLLFAVMTRLVAQHETQSVSEPMPPVSPLPGGR